VRPCVRACTPRVWERLRRRRRWRASASASATWRPKHHAAAAPSSPPTSSPRFFHGSIRMLRGLNWPVAIVCCVCTWVCGLMGAHHPSRTTTRRCCCEARRGTQIQMLLYRHQPLSIIIHYPPSLLPSFAATVPRGAKQPTPACMFYSYSDPPSSLQRG
jgi:hypothetical protein